MSNPTVSDLIRHIKKDENAADRLIQKFGSLYGVLEADMRSVANALDGDMTTSIYIRLVSALASRREVDLFKFGKKHTEREIERYFRSLFFGLSVETVYVMLLRNGKVIGCERGGEGTINSSNVLPRKLLEITRAGKADSVILAHNHPGGYAIPSDEDRAATRLLYEFFRSSGVRLISHYVVAGAECRKIDFNPEN